MKKKLLLLPVIALMGAGAVAFGTMKSESIVVRAEEESTTEVVESVEESVELETIAEEEQQKENVIKVFIDTYVVPIVATLGVGFFVSVIYGVTMAFVNAARNKKMVSSNQEAAEMVSQFIKVCGELLKNANENEKQFLEMKKVFEEKLIAVEELVIKEVGEAKEVANQIAEETEKCLDMKSVLLILVELESELAKINPSAVSSGVVKKIAELQAQARKLL